MVKDQRVNVTSLIEAIKAGNFKLVEDLTQKGADLNSRSKEGNPVLFFAASSWPMIDFLIKKGADINARNKFGTTLLMVAADRADLDLTKKLIESGADFNIKNNDGFTTLMLAIQKKSLPITKFILKCGFDVNMCRKNGLTALSCAMSCDFYEAVEPLIEHGANMLIRVNYGKGVIMTALDRIEYYKDRSKDLAEIYENSVKPLKSYMQELSKIIGDCEKKSEKTQPEDNLVKSVAGIAELIKKEGYEKYILAIFNSSFITHFAVKKENVNLLQYLENAGLIDLSSFDNNHKTPINLFTERFKDSKKSDNLKIISEIIEDENQLRNLKYNYEKQKEIYQLISESFSSIMPGSLINIMVGYLSGSDVVIKAESEKLETKTPSNSPKSPIAEKQSEELQPYR